MELAANEEWRRSAAQQAASCTPYNICVCVCVFVKGRKDAPTGSQVRQRLLSPWMAWYHGYQVWTPGQRMDQGFFPKNLPFIPHHQPPSPRLTGGMVLCSSSTGGLKLNNLLREQLTALSFEKKKGELFSSVLWIPMKSEAEPSQLFC